jgi:hypothetical protein
MVKMGCNIGTYLSIKTCDRIRVEYAEDMICPINKSEFLF